MAFIFAKFSIDFKLILCYDRNLQKTEEIFCNFSNFSY